MTTAHSATQTDQRSSNAPSLGDPVLDTAREVGRHEHLPFAGSVTAQQAWALVQAGQAQLIDVRTNEERTFVGYVPDALHVAWATGTSMNRNPRFERELEAKVRDKQAVLLLLCRSGKRSAAAAEVLTKAGFNNVFNVLQGFEGDLNALRQRGHSGGWRWDALPWIQD